jgi:hypothetical protein
VTPVEATRPDVTVSENDVRYARYTGDCQVFWFFL